MRFWSVLPIILALTTSTTSVADTVTLRNGSKVNGTIVRQDRSQVTLSDSTGNLRTFACEDIAKVETNDTGKKAPPPQPPAVGPLTPKPQSTAPADTVQRLADVWSEGVGSTEEEARKEALRQAVAKVVGTLVVAGEEVKNDTLIDQKILTYTDGYVERYDTLKTTPEPGGRYRVKIHAWVRAGKLTKALADNAIQVREIDARSLQGKSETIAEQSKSASDLVMNLFDGFPEKVLTAEPLEPQVIKSEGALTTFEIPVRIRLDANRWAAWVAEARRILDPISTKKGSERWNLRSKGWASLAWLEDDAAPPTKGASTGGSQSRSKPDQGKGVQPERSDSPEKTAIRAFSQSYWLERFVPESERSGIVLTVARPDSMYRNTVPLFKPAATHRRVVAILDSVGGVTWWWQLPQDAWDRLTSGHEGTPELEVRVTGPRGEDIATPITDWTEFIGDSKPGSAPEIAIEPSDQIGHVRLTVGKNTTPLDALGNSASAIRWTCAAVFTSEGDRLVPDRHLELDERVNDLVDLGVLYFPGAGFWARRFAVVPCMVLPYRFTLERGLIPEDGKLHVEATFRQDHTEPGPFRR
jgi:hypothetical protein